MIHAGIAVQPVLQLPRAEEIAAWRRGGFLGSTASVGAQTRSLPGRGPALPKELALRSGGTARALLGHPGLCSSSG